MSHLHPSESPALGWLVPCLAVSDVAASRDWYAQLDLQPIGGDIEQGWLMLASRQTELHLFSEAHCKRDTLNFRGGDVGAITAALAERGHQPQQTPQLGEAGSGSALFAGPEGRPVFFDTSPPERERYLAGERLTTATPADHADGLELGNLSCCLAVAELDVQLAYWRALGLVSEGEMPGGSWAIAARADAKPVPGLRVPGTYLGLFQGMFEGDLLCWRGGDLEAIADRLGSPIDGSSVRTEDPDGRTVMFDTAPGERIG